MEASLSKAEEQVQIKKWFNKTYETKGFFYLRPIHSYKVFITILKAKKGDNLLDVACGPGMMLKAGELKELNTTGVDLSEKGIELAKEFVPNSNVQVANAEALPFEEKTFDKITCLGSLERMLDLKQVLSEQKRVAKDDADFCYMVRNSDTLLWRIKLFFGLRNKQGHQGAKSLEEWKSIFTENGFDVQHVYKDTWQWVKWFRWLGLGWLINYDKVAKIPMPLKYCFEFVFLLKKAK